MDIPLLATIQHLLMKQGHITASVNSLTLADRCGQRCFHRQVNDASGEHGYDLTTHTSTKS